MQAPLYSFQGFNFKVGVKSMKIIKLKFPSYGSCSCGSTIGVVRSEDIKFGNLAANTD